jgi:hypothetical protein
MQNSTQSGKGTEKYIFAPLSAIIPIICGLISHADKPDIR